MEKPKCPNCGKVAHVGWLRANEWKCDWCRIKFRAGNNTELTNMRYPYSEAGTHRSTEKIVPCSNCGRTGLDKDLSYRAPCHNCKGTGLIRLSGPPQLKPCKVCDGTGRNRQILHKPACDSRYCNKGWVEI